MNLPQKDAQAIANGLAKMQKDVNRRTDFEGRSRVRTGVNGSFEGIKVWGNRKKLK